MFLETIIPCFMLLLQVLISVFLLSQWKCPHRPEPGFLSPGFSTILLNNWPIWRTVIDSFKRQYCWDVSECPSFFSLLPTVVACHGITWKLLSCSLSHLLHPVDLKLHYFLQTIFSAFHFTPTGSSYLNEYKNKAGVPILFILCCKLMTKDYSSNSL